MPMGAAGNKSQRARCTGYVICPCRVMPEALDPESLATWTAVLFAAAVLFVLWYGALQEVAADGDTGRAADVSD